MRIAVINPYGAGVAYSGPALFAQRLFRLVSADHDVTLLYGRRGSEGANHSWAHHSIPVMTFSGYGALEQLSWSLRVICWLLRNAKDYDYVHIHGAAFFNLVTALGALGRRSRYVLVALAACNDLSATSRVARIPGLSPLRRFLVSRAAVGFALSDDIGAEYVALGLPAAKVVAIHNPVATDLFAPPPAGLIDERASSRALGFVGILGPRKRPELLLDVVALLRGRGFEDARAVFVGPFECPDYERTFREHIAQLGISGAIEIVGYTTEVWRWMNAEMSVLVHPSSKEGLPGALVEAMASGLPAVVTDVGAMGAVVRAANAGYVVSAEPGAIAECVAELWRDGALWAGCSEAARRYACSHFDVLTVVEGYLSAVGAALSRQERVSVS